MRYWLMKSEPDEFSIDDLAAAPRQEHGLVRGSQLSGTQFHARQMQCRRPGVFLPFELSGTGHRGHCASVRAGLSRRDPVRSQKPVLRPQVKAGRSALGQCRCQIVTKTRLLSLAELRAHPQLAACGLCSGATGCRSRRWIRPNGRSSSACSRRGLNRRSAAEAGSSAPCPWCCAAGPGPRTLAWAP